MKKQDIVAKTAEFVKTQFQSEGTGHDWWHMYRVWQLAKNIASEEESVDMTVVELAALLHDIADFKFHNNDLEVGPKAARKWLESVGADKKTIGAVEDVVRNISFKGASVKNDLRTIEGQIVHDADKLDAIGAIGIGRAFAYGGASRRLMHDPETKAQLHDNFEAYANAQSPTITHFYEKLLLLKDRMFTDTGKRLAAHRHEFMEKYLEEFFEEWEGKL